MQNNTIAFTILFSQFLWKSNAILQQYTVCPHPSPLEADIVINSIFLSLSLVLFLCLSKGHLLLKCPIVYRNLAFFIGPNL